MDNQELNNNYEPISLKNYYYIIGSGTLLSVLGLTAQTIGTFSDSLKEFISNEALIKYGLYTFGAACVTMTGSSIYYASMMKNRDNQSTKGLENRL